MSMISASMSLVVSSIDSTSNPAILCFINSKISNTPKFPSVVGAAFWSEWMKFSLWYILITKRHFSTKLGAFPSIQPKKQMIAFVCLPADLMTWNFCPVSLFVWTYVIPVTLSNLSTSWLLWLTDFVQIYLQASVAACVNVPDCWFVNSYTLLTVL